jgi:hypothetical protein
LERALAEGGYRWYLFGAQAVVVYGRPRLSADVDITIDLEPEAATELTAHLQASGFFPRVENLQQFLQRTRVLPLLHEETGIPVDAVLGGAGIEREFLANARCLDLGGVTVPVISPEDLVVSKILAGRSKDLEDARSVLAEQGSGLDLDRVRRWLSLLEEALDRQDLLSELDRQLRE